MSDILDAARARATLEQEGFDPKYHYMMSTDVPFISDPDMSMLAGTYGLEETSAMMLEALTHLRAGISQASVASIELDRAILMATCIDNTKLRTVCANKGVLPENYANAKRPLVKMIGKVLDATLNNPLFEPDAAVFYSVDSTLTVDVRFIVD